MEKKAGLWSLKVHRDALPTHSFSSHGMVALSDSPRQSAFLLFRNNDVFRGVYDHALREVEFTAVSARPFPAVRARTWFQFSFAHSRKYRRVFAVGGSCDGDGILAAMRVFDLDAQTWSAHRDPRFGLPEQRFDSCLVLDEDGDTLRLCGGAFNNNDVRATHWSVDLKKLFADDSPPPTL